MIRRLYVENFRCLSRFTLDVEDKSSLLLIGKNGAGKSAIRDVLLKIRQLAMGQSRVSDVFSPSDLNWNMGETKIDFRLQVEVGIDRIIDYELELTTSEKSHEFEVSVEKLGLQGQAVFSRAGSGVNMTLPPGSLPSFPIDSRVLALPILQESSPDDAIALLRRWLANLLIVSPVPELVTGESSKEANILSLSCNNFGEWFRGFTTSYPASGTIFLKYLRQVWPDLETMVNSSTGRESKSLDFRFKEDDRQSPLTPLANLSQGEKCLVIWAAVMAWADVTDSAVCFWDEPDNFISLDEVGDLISRTRREFESRKQLIATSHNPETIREFTAENTFVLRRDSHLSSTRPPIRASEIEPTSDLADSIARSEVFNFP